MFIDEDRSLLFCSFAVYHVDIKGLDRLYYIWVLIKYAKNLFKEMVFSVFEGKNIFYSGVSAL